MFTLLHTQGRKDCEGHTRLAYLSLARRAS